MNECPKGAALAQSSAQACPVVTQGAGCGLPCAGLVREAPEPLGGGGGRPDSLGTRMLGLKWRNTPIGIN